MKPKEIQEQRIRTYFVDAAKSIIKSEGMHSVSVRNVAKEAGYSYATLYNYFKNINNLIFECVKDFQQECDEFVQPQIVNMSVGVNRIEKKLQAYVDFMVEYPSIFDLFFLAKMSVDSVGEEVGNIIASYLGHLCKEDWDYCISKESFTEEEVLQKQQLINNSLTGLLVNYLNRRYPNSYADFGVLAEQTIYQVLK